MNLYKRPESKFWHYYFSHKDVKYRGSTNRPITDKAGALKVLNAEYQKVLDNIQFGVRQEITLAEAMKATIESVQGNTRRSYANSRDSLLGLGFFEGLDRWSFDGSRSMSSLKQRDLTDHRLNRRNETTRRGDQLRANSINIEIRFLRRVYNFARMDLEAASTPDLKFPQLDGFEKHRYITLDEEGAILKALTPKKTNHPESGIAHRKAHDLYVTLVDTGISLGEGLGLRWNQCDMHKLQLEIRRQKTKTPCLVPISDRLLEVLHRNHNQPSPLQSMSRAVRILRETISEVCNTDEHQVAELGGATIHSLRDTFATRQVSKGLSLYEVSKMIGHLNTSMTKKYAHLETTSVVDKARANLNGGK